MKTNPHHLLAALFFACLAFNAAGQPVDARPESDYPEKGMVPNTNMLHIGIIVRDIEAAMNRWAAFLGVSEMPNILTTGNNENNPTEYRGHPSDAKAKLAFFTLENLQVELIEPLSDDPSSWKEVLDTKGECVHHIAFGVKGMGERYLDEYENAGYPVAQHGGWDTGEYGYMDTLEGLGVVVELLEFYNEQP